tara:strand:+ start:3473 stop:3628 length:156 start_codon:yes stop_codon:yes gene_type:complete
MAKSKFQEIDENSDVLMKEYIIGRMKKYLMQYELDEILEMYLGVKEEIHQR